MQEQKGIFDVSLLGERLFGLWFGGRKSGKTVSMLSVAKQFLNRKTSNRPYKRVFYFSCSGVEPKELRNGGINIEIQSFCSSSPQALAALDEFLPYTLYILDDAISSILLEKILELWEVHSLFECSLFIASIYTRHIFTIIRYNADFHVYNKEFAGPALREDDFIRSRLDQLSQVETFPAVALLMTPKNQICSKVYSYTANQTRLAQFSVNRWRFRTWYRKYSAFVNSFYGDKLPTEICHTILGIVFVNHG